jgi:predicted HTH transcriptional regulator
MTHSAMTWLPQTIMSEKHNIEYKESWRDEYLKWVSGFANAYGGRIYIGINDKGEVTGVSKSKKMMDDIPNKIVSFLGIVADVNLLEKNSKKYIEIIISPSSVPISYKGSYYYRSGSTKQELKVIKDCNVWKALRCQKMLCAKPFSTPSYIRITLALQSS